MRNANIKRDTNETKINLFLEIDGTGESEISTGIGFFDHMLELFARHSKVDLKIDCKGDLNVCGHHTVEDIGIVLGQAIDKALGDKKGITRYAGTRIPMDEALISFDLDISGRPFLVFNANLPTAMVGEFDTSLTEEFFRGLMSNAKMTSHINCEYGTNTHHIIEGMFKAFARAFREAVKIDENFKDQIPSTKGVI